jgi:hypothetical protein
MIIGFPGRRRIVAAATAEQAASPIVAALGEGSPSDARRVAAIE